MDYPMLDLLTQDADSLRLGLATLVDTESAHVAELAKAHGVDLAPLRAREIAAAKVLHLAQTEWKRIETTMNRGELSDELEAIYFDSKQAGLYDRLVNLTKSRTLGNDTDAYRSGGYIRCLEVTI